MAEVIVEITGDQAKAEKAYAAAEKAAKAHAATVEATNTKVVASDNKAIASKGRWTEAEREHYKAMKEGAAITQSLLTPQEKFNAKVNEAAALLKKGTLTTETYNRQIAKLTDELADATTNVDKLAAAQKEAFDREITAAAKRYDDEVARGEALIRKNTTAQQRLDQELKEAKTLFDRGRISADDYKNAIARITEEQNRLQEEKGGISEGIEQLAKYAAGAGVVATSVKAIQSVWQQVNEEQERGLKTLESMRDVNRDLRQVSTPEEFAARKDTINNLASETGVDRTVIGKAMSDAINANIESEVPAIIRENEIMPIQESMTVSSKIPSIFPGVSPQQARGLAFYAGSVTQAGPKDLAANLPTAAEGARVAGFSYEQTTAAQALLSPLFKDPARAADRIKHLGAKIGTDTGGTQTDAEYQEKVDTEKKRALEASRQLRDKEQSVTEKEKRVSQLEERVTEAKTPLAKKHAEQTLDNARQDVVDAKREVSEFDRDKLKEKTIEDKRRSSLKGSGDLIATVEKFQSLPQNQQQQFLGEDSELSIAMQSLINVLPQLKELSANLQSEKGKINAGGGMMQEQLAAAAADPDTIALRDRDRARNDQSIAEEKQFGVKGAKVEGAQALVTAGFANGSLSERVIGAKAGQFLAQGAVEAGASQQGAANASVGAIKTTDYLLGAAASGSAGPLGPLLYPLQRIAESLVESNKKTDKTNELLSKQAAPQVPKTDPNAIRANAKKGEAQ